MTENPALLHPESPLRPADWRWQRACWLWHQDRSPRRRDDALTRATWRFLKNTASAREMKAISQALALEQGLPSKERWLLQARLLTDLSFSRIGTLTDPEHPFSGAIIRWYHDLFFSVRDAPEARDRIRHIILQGRLPGSIPVDDLEFHLKDYAWKGGILALDEVLDYHARRHLLVEPDALPVEDRCHLLRIHVAILAQALRPGTVSLSTVQELRRQVENLPVFASEPLLRPLDLAFLTRSQTRLTRSA